MAATRHPGEQRRYYARSKHAQDDRRRLGGGDKCQPERHVLLHQRGRASHDQSEVRAHHQYQLGGRANGAFGQANYAASKGGIIAFTKTLALEMAKFNITANAVAPGFTSTEMVDAIPEEIAAQIKAKIPLGRFASPEEIAKATAFLAADGDYITGQELNVNGGYHM